MKVTVEILRFNTKTQVEIAKKMDNVDELKRLAYVADEEVLCAIASNESSTSEVLNIVAKRGTRLAKAYVVFNEKTSPETLRELALCGDSAVRLMVACSGKTPKDALEILMEDEIYEVREMARMTLAQ